MRFLFLILLSGCAAKSTLCSSTIAEKKSLLGDVERNTTCSCECPKPQINIIDTAATIGGLIRLEDSR